MPVPKDFDPGFSHPYYFMRKGLLHAVKKWAPSLKGKLLDFGCGSKPYRSLFNVEEYIGLDFQKTGHDHTGEEIDIFYDGKTIPFPDEYFDSILCSEVAEHLFNLPDVLNEMRRVLKKNGTILMTCPFVWNEHEAPYDYARYTRFALADIMEKNGFILAQFEKRGTFVEAITQMKVNYFNSWASPGLYKLSLPGRFLLRSTISIMNAWGSLKNKVLPGNEELYLSNILVIKKIAAGIHE